MLPTQLLSARAEDERSIVAKIARPRTPDILKALLSISRPLIIVHAIPSNRNLRHQAISPLCPFLLVRPAGLEGGR